MNKTEMVKKGNKEAYKLLAEDVFNYLQDYLKDSIIDYKYLGFSDEISDFIDKEIEQDKDNSVVYEIIDPALEKIRTSLLDTLLGEDSNDTTR